MVADATAREVAPPAPLQASGSSTSAASSSQAPPAGTQSSTPQGRAAPAGQSSTSQERAALPSSSSSRFSASSGSIWQKSSLKGTSALQVMKEMLKERDSTIEGLPNQAFKAAKSLSERIAEMRAEATPEMLEQVKLRANLLMAAAVPAVTEAERSLQAAIDVVHTLKVQSPAPISDFSHLIGYGAKDIWAVLGALTNSEWETMIDPAMERPSVPVDGTEQVTWEVVGGVESGTQDGIITITTLRGLPTIPRRCASFRSFSCSTLTSRTRRTGHHVAFSLCAVLVGLISEGPIGATIVI